MALPQIDLLAHGFGTAYSGGKAYAYNAGTSALTTWYSDAAGTIPAANPYTLDSEGKAVLYSSARLKIDVRNSAGVSVPGFPVDNLGFGVYAPNNWIMATDYGADKSLATITAALAAIGSSTTTLHFEPGTWEITDNITIPANVKVSVDYGTVFSVAVGKVLTISGPFTAGIHQVFSGLGSARLRSNYASVIYPQWFGAKGDGTTDDTDAIKAAIASITTSFDIGYGSTIYFTKTSNNGQNSYQISSVIEVPPGIILRGEGIFNGSNRSGSHIRLTHDGVGFRFVRRNSTGNLFHNGGMYDIAMSGTGTSSTLAQRLVELGDSADVATTTGAWNGVIRDCLFNNTRGYGIYSAHSQEWLLDHNFFIETNRAVNFSTAPASSRVINSTFINQSTTECDYAANYEPGTLGGTSGLKFIGNYVIGFKTAIHITSCKSYTVMSNMFEGIRNTAIQSTTQTYDGVDIGTGDPDLPSGLIIGNGWINAGAAGRGTYAVVLHNTRNTLFESNTNSSPNAALVSVLHLTEDSAGLCSGNILHRPRNLGTNSGTVPVFDYSNALYDRNTVVDQRYYKERNDTSYPTLSSNMAGTAVIVNGRRRVLLPDNTWVQVATFGSVTLPAGTTTASVNGLSLVVNQNNSSTTLDSFTGGQDGQIVTIRAVSADTPVNVTGTSITIPINKTLTVQYSTVGSKWIEIARSFAL